MELCILKRNFTYHKPQGTQTERYEEIRNKAFEFAMLINSYCPESREKSLALTQLETCVMWANAAIARNEEAVPEEV